MESLQLIVCFSAVAVLTPCRGFSVDTEQPIIFRETVKSFGYSVVQFGNGTNGGVLVGAPLQQGGVNETGKLYKCQGTSSKSGGCQEIDLQRPPDAVNMSLGLSVSAHDSQVLVCGPRVHQPCGEYIYLKGYCFLLDQNLRQIQRFPNQLPECARRPADIVFLIDGSGSISTRQFSQMKTFISEVIKRFQNTNTQFGLSQYSGTYEEHFDFLSFKNSRNPDNLIKTIFQLRGATHTATYIQKVVREMFLPEKGARSDASKILIVITDGEKSGDYLDYSDVIPEAQSANIIRFAIGVGYAFSRGTARQELISIASEPSMNYVFAVNNFDALKDIQNSLQNKIFAIEGTQSQNTGNISQSFELELSQEGFSALHTQSGTILGAVGAYDWAGGLFLFNSQDDATFINVSRWSTDDLKSAYLGYSIQEVQFNGRSSFVVGAPRYQHVGKVVWFSQRRGQWRQKSELALKQSPQIGSYFGATLCAVDLNRDGNTDLILVGAPMYYDGIAGGRVYVCQRQGEAFFCGMELQGERRHPLGRFGTSIAEAGEITGDRWTDVAVGAPLEDENQGAVYIFQGLSSSLNPVFSQRIQASAFANKLQYFGQALDGGSEITGDGLPDLAVGADGQVLLLRARPVVSMVSTITFNPTMIPISAFECVGQEVLNREVSTATVNFKIQGDSRFTFGSDILSTIQYTLTLDPGRQKVRAVFNQGSGLSTLTEEMKIGMRPESRQYRIKLPNCIEDSLTPIVLQMDYSLRGEPIQRANNLRPILQKEATSLILASLPFEKNCGKDGICKDELKTSFNFSGLNELVVGLTLELNATVFIRNDGEDSYRTNVTFIYPASLSYRRFILVQSNRKNAVIKCTSVPAVDVPVRNTTCDINHPIFRSMAEVIFIVSFFVSQDANLGSVVRINATAASENNVAVTKDMFHQMELPVKYAIFVFINSLDKSTKYVNFSAGQEAETRTVEHRYELKNTYHQNATVSVTFQIPVSLNEIQVWNAVLDVPKEFPQIICAPGRITPGSKEFVKQLSKQPVLDCSVATCKTITCNVPSLERHQPVEFKIKGDVGLKWFSQTQQKKVILKSSAQVFYDESKYKQKEGFMRVQAETAVEFLEPYNYLPIIIGSTVGGLVLLVLIIAVLYKLGFFKRQYKQMMEAADDPVAESPQETSTPSEATKG